jgi:3-oxoadipate CoA-transferase alpha subunit
MINKIVDSPRAAMSSIPAGARVMIGGFGESGLPEALIDALIDHGAPDLTVISNNAGVGKTGIAKLLASGLVRRLECTYPRSVGSVVVEELYNQGKLQLEVIPQGTFSERIRAAGAGIGGFYVKTGVGTKAVEGKEVRSIAGCDYVFEAPLHADFALIKADRGDRWGNLTYHAGGRCYGPVMAPAAMHTIAEVRQIVDLGALHPEEIITPGIFVESIVERNA